MNTEEIIKLIEGLQKRIEALERDSPGSRKGPGIAPPHYHPPTLPQPIVIYQPMVCPMCGGNHPAGTCGPWC